jgi:histidine triad (HIT) family protein
MIGAAEGVSAEVCVFCAIMRGDREASFVHLDEQVVAFADIQPVTPGHVLTVGATNVPLKKLRADPGSTWAPRPA